MDINKLKPVPWETDKNAHHEWLIGYPGKDNNGRDDFFYVAHEMEKDDAEFCCLARNAFEIMVRRGWSVRSEWCNLNEFVVTGWNVVDQNGVPLRQHYVSYGDPFTALIEADMWYKENIKK